MPRYLHAHFRNGHGFGSKPVASSTKGAIPAYGTIAQFNRWTGKPHEHRREIERRLRQAAR